MLGQAHGAVVGRCVSQLHPGVPRQAGDGDLHRLRGLLLGADLPGPTPQSPSALPALNFTLVQAGVERRYECGYYNHNLEIQKSKALCLCQSPTSTAAPRLLVANFLFLAPLLLASSSRHL